MNELYHHGIPGQKWGVRNGPPYPIRSNKKVAKDVNDIYSTLTPQEKYFFTGGYDEKYIHDANEHAAEVVKTYIKYYGKTPMSFLELYKEGDNAAIGLATRNSEKARGKGYASANVKEAIKWFNEVGSKQFDNLVWYADKNNKPSIRLAEKNNFKKFEEGDDGRDLEGNPISYVGLKYKHKR